MKKITILLVIIFTFLFSTTSWGEWSYVTENLVAKFYIDKDRVRKSGKYIYFWDLLDFKSSSYTHYIQLDCSIFRLKTLKFHVHNQGMGEGSPIEEWTPPDEWNYPQPDTVIEFRYKYICEEHQ